MCGSVAEISSQDDLMERSYSILPEGEFKDQVSKIFSGEPWVGPNKPGEHFKSDSKIADINKKFFDPGDKFSYDADTMYTGSFKCSVCGCTLINSAHQVDGNVLCNKCFDELYRQSKQHFATTTTDETADYCYVPPTNEDKAVGFLERIAIAFEKFVGIDREPKTTTSSTTGDYDWAVVN